MRFAFLISLIALAGCAASYQVPAGREAAFARDENACKAEAYRVYPEKDFPPNKGMEQLAYQLNRDRYEERCMNGKGYSSK
jgi:hypothetical protein